MGVGRVLRTVHPIMPLFGTNQEALVSESFQKSYPSGPLLFRFLPLVKFTPLYRGGFYFHNIDKRFYRSFPPTSLRQLWQKSTFAKLHVLVWLANTVGIDRQRVWGHNVVRSHRVNINKWMAHNQNRHTYTCATGTVATTTTMYSWPGSIWLWLLRRL
jgi:hypothetical protein